jgi:hypothetical protein
MHCADVWKNFRKRHGKAKRISTAEVGSPNGSPGQLPAMFSRPAKDGENASLRRNREKQLEMA